MTTEVTLSASDARSLTDRIKVGVEAIWDLIKQAYTERAWEALGYVSWDDYCTREFGTSRLRLPREERSEVVASLRESGLSTRAIAAATGLSQPTVSRELSSAPTDSNESVAPITGVNGKTYAPTQPKPKPEPDWIDAAEEADPIEVAPGITADQLAELNPQPQPREPTAPRRRPLEEGFFDATQRLDKAVTSLKNLGKDDRLPRNKEQVARYRHDLLRAIDQLQLVADLLK